MSKPVKRIDADKRVWHISSIETTLHMMPHYNGFACGYGLHGDVKYNRAKEKNRLRKQKEI